MRILISSENIRLRIQSSSPLTYLCTCSQAVGQVPPPIPIFGSEENSSCARYRLRSTHSIHIFTHPRTHALIQKPPHSSIHSSFRERHVGKREVAASPPLHSIPCPVMARGRVTPSPHQNDRPLSAFFLTHEGPRDPSRAPSRD